jgi:hypothetical protein
MRFRYVNIIHAFWRRRDETSATSFLMCVLKFICLPWKEGEKLQHHVDLHDQESETSSVVGSSSVGFFSPDEEHGQTHSTKHCGLKIEILIHPAHQYRGGLPRLGKWWVYVFTYVDTTIHVKIQTCIIYIKMLTRHVSTLKCVIITRTPRC